MLGARQQTYKGNQLALKQKLTEVIYLLNRAGEVEVSYEHNFHCDYSLPCTYLCKRKCKVNDAEFSGKAEH